MRRRSFRTLFRDFQRMRGPEPESSFVADLEFLENRDLDLSVRLGAMLAFNALMITVGTHPITASPGAPLTLDASAHPLLTILSCVAIIPVVVSSWLCLRALLIGEDFGPAPIDADSKARRAYLFAAFVKSIDAQSRLLAHAIRWSMAGGLTTIFVWVAILADKMV